MPDIICADVLDWAATYQGPRFHALLCDPPYELGFMGKDWDRSGVAFKPETWAALAEHLHPGAFGMAFASSRGWHRLAVAIEDAGLRIHPAIFGWSFGSGFPKATRIDTQIDKAAGAERVVAGKNDNHRNPGGNSWPSERQPHTADGAITAPATELAAAWQGHRYGLQALKPALEPIIVFQKPYEGKPVECIVETGAGSLWIDGGRISADDQDVLDAAVKRMTDNDAVGWKNTSTDGIQPVSAQGRWPANFTLTHHPDCVRTGVERVRGNGRPNCEGKQYGAKTEQIYGEYEDNVHKSYHTDPDGLETIASWDCVPECPVRRLGEQSGRRGQLVQKNYKRNSLKFPGSVYEHSWTREDGNDTGANYSDTGTAARFFFQASWELDHADPVFYCAKASRKERDAGLEDLPDSFWSDGRQKTADHPKQRAKTPRRNGHPTVKPITLAKHLATLLLPPPEYAPRRILIPFMGSGSEAIGAGLVGWEHITAIDSDPEAVAIAEARLAHWLKEQTDPQQMELAV